MHLTEKGCPEMADDGLSSFETNRSRSEVNFDVRVSKSNHAPRAPCYDATLACAQVDEKKPNCALIQPTKGHAMLQLDGTCATEVVAGEIVEGFEFEPRCLVVVTSLENEEQLFNAMLSAGRLLTDPFVS